MSGKNNNSTVSVFACNTIAELPGIAAQLIPLFHEHAIITFLAPMGAGKTTLIKAVCKAMGVDEREISSPTYSLVNTYQTPEKTLYHFDLYRLKSMAEALDFGIEEYLESGNLCLIEWSELIAPLLPLAYIQISIEVTGEKRTITLHRINF